MGGRVTAIVFDLDGTLVDSAPDLRATLNLMLDQCGLPPLSLRQVVSMVGDGLRVLLDRALDASGAAASPAERGRLFERFRALYTHAPVEHTRPYPGVGDMLAELRQRGYRLGVCTNKERGPAVAILRALELDPFDAVVGGSCTPARKPEPAPLLECLRRLDASPRHACMVGDSRNDILAAQRAGVRCIAVAHGYGGEAVARLRADARIDGFAALPAALRRLDDRGSRADADGPPAR
jgi:phosphoglycolate phosphatase